MRHVCSAALFALGLLWPGPAGAQVQSYRLEVRGLGSPFLAYGLERVLVAIEGVRDVELGMAEGSVGIALVPGATLMPDAIVEGVREAGLELVRVEATVRGSLRGSGERTRLIFDGGGPLSFVLLPGPASDALESMRAEGTEPLQVRGPVVRHGDRWGLGLESVGKVPEG